jgi:hypothetical protein
MKKQTKPLNRQAEEAARRGAGLAVALKGRGGRFKNKKKDANRKACRGQA